MTKQEREVFQEWCRSRPLEVQQVMLRFPPGTKVKAVDGIDLICPAPGVVGDIMSYTQGENGVGVRVTDGINGACCDLDWLEIVSKDDELEKLVRQAVMQ